MVKFSLILSIALLLMLAPITCLAGEVTVSTSRSQIGINESVTVQITVAGSSDEEPDLSVLEKDFDIVSRSQSSSINIINGDVSRSKVWTLTLIPRRVGILPIPAICCDGKCAKATTIAVTEQSAADNETASILIEASVSKQQAIEQEQLLYTVRVLLRQPLLQASLSDLKPQGVDTIVQRLGDDKHYEIQRDSWRYKVIERNYALFPQHSGTLQLPPMQLDGIVRNATPTNYRSPFDNFAPQGQRIRRRSNALTVEVLEPPRHNNGNSANQPWLPAQQIVLEDDWQQTPPTLTVGEPATRTITTTANGLTAAQLPELQLPVPEGFKAYPDKTVRNNQQDDDGVIGQMIQKIALVPTTAGTFTLPPTSMRWWSVKDNKWRKSTIASITLQVLPAQRTAIPAVSNEPTTKPAVNASETNIVPPQQRQTDKQPEITTKAPANHDNQLWFWISMACATGWLISVFYLWRRKHHPAPPANSPPVSHRTTTTEKSDNCTTPKQQVIQYATANQASNTSMALHNWLATLGIEMDHFLSVADEPLRAEIICLNTYLYGKNQHTNEAWDGTALAQQIQRWQSEKLDELMSENITKERRQRNNKQAGKNNDLPSFYPKS